MAGPGSLKRQAQVAFTSLGGFGNSKRAEKLARQAKILASTGKKIPLNKIQVEGIYSYRTLRTYLNLVIPFLEWARSEYDVRYLTQLDMATMGTRYIRERFLERRRADGRPMSTWTGKTVRAALTKLTVAVKCKYGCDVGSLDRAALGAMRPRRLADRLWAGQYQPEEAASIVRWVGAKRSLRAQQAALVLELQWHCGLRISEAVGLRARMVDLTAGLIEIRDTNITKGGRNREPTYPISDGLVRRLAPLVSAARGPDGRVFGVQPDYVRRLLRQACRDLGIQCHGTHGLRHSYANDLYTRAIESGATPERAKAVVAEALGHSRPGITSTYVRF